jgi:hypothetical protein
MKKKKINRLEGSITFKTPWLRLLNSKARSRNGRTKRNGTSGKQPPFRPTRPDEEEEGDAREG